MNSQEITTKLRMIKNKFFCTVHKIIEEHNITQMEFDLLNCIYFSNREGKQIQASTLAKWFDVSIPAVMHKLVSLEEKGMVLKKQDEKDKRVKYYTLTEETNLQMEELFEQHKKKVEMYFKALGEEQEHLNAILDITIQFLEEHND